MRYISEGTLREVIFHVRLLDLSSCLLFSRFSYFLPLSLATSPPSFPRLLLCIVADPGMGLYREPWVPKTAGPVAVQIGRLSSQQMQAGPSVLGMRRAMPLNQTEAHSSEAGRLA
jgi:hypothetical protein